MNYFIHKLIEKSNIRMKYFIGGENNEPNLEVLSKLTQGLSFGRYRLIWNNNCFLKELKRIDDNVKIHQEFGKYSYYENGIRYILHSSEFINFNKKELREFNLNFLL